MTFIVSFVFTSTILIGCSKNEQLVDRDINVKKFLEFRVDSNSYEGMALIRPFYTQKNAMRALIPIIFICVNQQLREIQF